MNEYLKKNINRIIGIFLILQPVLDILTGICVNTFKLDITIGIIVRILFLLFICTVVLFVFKKKKVLIPYLIIGLYFIFYLIGMIIFKDSSILSEIKSLVRTFYFPLIFVSLYSIKDEIKISNMTLLTVLFLYLIFLFVPTLFGLGYKSYEITKVGTLGFYNSANELSGIISLLTPIMFIIFVTSKKIIPIVVLSFIYLVVILMMGTKTPLLTLIIVLGVNILYLGIRLLKKKKYKELSISLIVVLSGCIGLLIVIPKTNFYKNIETHLDYLGLDNVFEVFTSEKYIDHFIFSSRLKFLKNKSIIYDNSSIYEKLFGIGYINNNKETKLIEMDYFDIYYSHGLVGFLIYYIIVLYLLYKILNNNKLKGYNNIMITLSIFLMIFLAFFTGHIMTAPSVSFVSVIILLSLCERKKKDLLFSTVSFVVGGIETSLITLLDQFDYKKYNVTVVLEQKTGLLLDQVNKNVTLKEVKVSNNKNIIIRKAINLLRKIIFTIENYKNYDYAACYATYSLSSDRLARIASNNTSFFVHSDYTLVYKDDESFYKFFNDRNVDKYRKIIFVTNESRDNFIKKYKNLKDKCEVYATFADVDKIERMSKEKIAIEKPKGKKLLVFVGRLEDHSKKVSRAINLVKEIDGLALWIVGDGPDRKMYEDLVEKEKLQKKVTFMGMQYNPYPYIVKADYVVLTSDYEGFALIYQEAIILNKEIIGTVDVSDSQMNIGKDFAFIVSKDEKEMVKQVKEILKGKGKMKKVDYKQIQQKRFESLEKIFNEVV